MKTTATREEAERIARLYAATVFERENLAAAINPAILDYGRERDERAAKIAECWLDNRAAKSWTSTQTANGIAAAIRSNDAK